MTDKNLPQTAEGYEQLLVKLKERIRQAQVQAAFAVNEGLTTLYWEIGSLILTQESQKGWGAKVVEKLANDLKLAFPEMRGFSARNLRYMKAFAAAYPDRTMVQAMPSKITWYHNCTLIDRVKDSEERIWYTVQTIENGWTRDVMVHQIESELGAEALEWDLELGLLELS